MRASAKCLRLLGHLLLLIGCVGLRAQPTQLTSPDGKVHFKIGLTEGRLTYSILFGNKPVIDPSPVQFTLDGVDLASQVELRDPGFYQLKQTYPWLGVHSTATNHCNGAKIPIRHPASNTEYMFEVRAFNSGAAFRIIVPGDSRARVPDEATAFLIPEGSTIWSHDLEGHYEDVHIKRNIADLPANEWIAPPPTIRLPGDTGYAAITESALINYSGMALQSDGQRRLHVRLGHAHPPSYPYRLRYSPQDIERLAKPAAIAGTIITPWRLVMVASDLNGLVNSDLVHNLAPPPDPRLFPKGNKSEWIRPGRAIWRYLDGGDSSLTNMIEFTRLAAELGFEHHILEGFWSRWSDADIRQLVEFANQKRVGIWLWKHSRSLREPAARHEFLKRCHDLGITGAKIDFFDHEAKEVIDLYQALLKEAAEYRLLLNFHGANKPAGESRTWPNELTREAIRGMEASRLTNRATHNVTLPFTRMLAGHAEYTPMHFGPRRQNTTWAHQIATAAILTAPLQTYAAHPMTMLTNPCVDVIKSIPSIWDETVVLPPSEIGEIAVFARRHGKVWFLAVLNGTTARKVEIPLTFLGPGQYQATLVRDLPHDIAAPTHLNMPMRRSNSLTIELVSGGGFVGRFKP